MPSVSPAKAPASFEVKSASLPLVGLLLKSAGLDALAADLRRHYGSTPDFFDHDPLLIDLSPLVASQPGAELDFAELLRTERKAGTPTHPRRWAEERPCNAVCNSYAWGL